MVRAAEGLHVRPSATDTDADGIGGEAVDAVTAAPPASLEAGAPERAAGPVPDAPCGASGTGPDPFTSGHDGGAQGNLPLPAERRRWDSLVSYPGDAGAGGDAQGAPPPAPASAEGAASAGGAPADTDAAASSAAQRAADDAALERKLDAVPAEPGVYLLRDRTGAKGAAKSAKPRVKSSVKSCTSARPSRCARACAPISAKAATPASRCAS